jgi:hypothetical protein
MSNIAMMQILMGFITFLAYATHLFGTVEPNLDAAAQRYLKEAVSVQDDLKRSGKAYSSNVLLGAEPMGVSFELQKVNAESYCMATVTFRGQAYYATPRTGITATKPENCKPAEFPKIQPTPSSGLDMKQIEPTMVFLYDLLPFIAGASFLFGGLLFVAYGAPFSFGSSGYDAQLAEKFLAALSDYQDVYEQKLFVGATSEAVSLEVNGNHLTALCRTQSDTWFVLGAKSVGDTPSIWIRSALTDSEARAWLTSRNNRAALEKHFALEP